MITLEILKILAPATLESTLADFAKGFEENRAKYGLTTIERIAAFVGNCSVETNFKPIREIWGPTADQRKYEFKKSLGNTVAGDGYKFRGRGYIQITGRANYKMVSMKMFGDDRLLSTPDLLLNPRNAVIAAFIWWEANKVNAIVDKLGIKGAAKKVNAGNTKVADSAINHMSKRVAAFNKIIFFLKKKVSNGSSNYTASKSPDTSFFSAFGKWIFGH